MLVDEVAAYLGTVTPSLGLIVTNKLPASPDKVLVVRSYPGGPPDGGFGVDGIQTEYPGVQLLARGEALDSEEPKLRLERAYQAMAKIQAKTLSGVFYRMVHAQGSPAPLETDENQREVYVCSFICEKEPSPTS